MKYRCKICGYIIEKEIDKDFVCPKCNAKRINFIDESIDKRVWVSEVNPSIMRINKKCINCGMCKNICENKIGIKYEKDKVLQPICINCGACVMSCPIGALVPRYDYQRVLEYIDDPTYTLVVSVAPSVRVALGDDFGLEPGMLVTGKMIKALRMLGFDYVFDVCYGADLTIIEEATELVNRIKENKNLPQFTSCCPAWIKYCEIFHDELLNNLSTTKSPISIQGSLIKSYFCQEKEIDANKVISVTIAPCTAKKYEIKREELQGNDFVLTTSELALMLKERGIDLTNLKEDKFDKLLSEATGAGIIFGNSGGVMESAIRTAYYLITKENPPKDILKLESLRGFKDLKADTIRIKDYEIKVAVVYGMKALEQILKEKEQYTFIEVMNCEGGCIGGGGQPLVLPNKIELYKKERSKSLYDIDNKKDKKSSYQNKEISELYDNFLDYPGSEKAHILLHTTYKSKKDMLETK